MRTKGKIRIKHLFIKTRCALRDFHTQHPVFYAIITSILAVGFSFAIEKCLRVYYNRFFVAGLNFNLTRLILVGVVTEIACLVLAFGQSGRDFLYRYRYVFGVGLFLLCVALRINYSSAGMLDGAIQPHYIMQTDDIVTGANRAIRTDEYVVATPMIMSQYRNDFSLTNPDIMADDVITAFYPKLPNKSPLSLLTSPQYLGFTFLPFENAFSFYQLLPWFVAFFAVFEMLMIFTKKRKLMSCIGSFFIILSPVLLWFDSVQNVMYVALLFDIFYLFIHYGKNWQSKIGFAALFGWVAACFAMIVYPAWQVPYGYVLLALISGLTIEYRKSLHWRDACYILPALLVIVALVLPNILISLDQYQATLQTVYPGKRFEHGGGGLFQMFYSISSIFFPLRDGLNPCEASGFVSLFPVPILLGSYTIWQAAKKRRYDTLLIGLVILSLFFSFMCLIGNSFVAKISLLFLTPSTRLCPILDFVCVLIIIRLLATRQTTELPKKLALLAIATAIITACLVYASTRAINTYANAAYMSPAMICAAFVLCYISIYSLLDIRESTIWLIGAVATLLASYQFLTIHPLRTGLDVYTDKPVAEKIRELSANNQSALWLASGSRLADYAVANDARVINSVNYYPTIDRWRLFDPSGENDHIYNRFAHVGVTISVQASTNFQLTAFDAFVINLNYQDACLLHPTYFLSDTDYNSIPGWSQKLIYREDGVYIYQLNCQ